MKTKSALPWFGSDASVAKELACLLSKCKHVTIPFAGGLGILPYLNASHVVANDLHSAAINFYRVASGEYGGSAQADLLFRCRGTLSHPEELATAQRMLANPDNDFCERAWAFWAICWIGRKGKGGTKHQGGAVSIRRTASGGSNASRLESAAADLYEWAGQFRRCEFECVDFRNCLGSVADKPDCGIYCDPPWFGAGRNYLHTFTDQDHYDLAMCLQRFQHAAIVVRYGDAPLIRNFYPPSEWDLIRASSRSQSNADIDEVWITRRAS